MEYKPAEVIISLQEYQDLKAKAREYDDLLQELKTATTIDVEGPGMDPLNQRAGKKIHWTIDEGILANIGEKHLERIVPRQVREMMDFEDYKVRSVKIRKNKALEEESK